MCLAVPLKVVELLGNERAQVADGAVTLEVSIALTPDVHPDQYVLVHAGFALDVLDPDEAQRTRREIERLVGGRDTEKSHA